MRLLFSLLLLLAFDCAATEIRLPAAGVAASRYVLNVSGVIDIEPDGSVGAASIVVPGEAGPVVEQAVRAWRFKPILQNGRPIRARAHVQISLRAEPDGSADGLKLFFDHVWFLDPPAEAGAGATGPSSALKPPVYPMRALEYGTGAYLTLLLKVGADGRVQESAVETMSLIRHEMPRRRGVRGDLTAIARAALEAAQDWRFPPGIVQAGGVVRVPVSFAPYEYDGRWLPLIGVDVTPEAWVAQAGGSVVALAAGGGAPSERFQPSTEIAGTPLN